MNSLPALFSWAVASACSYLYLNIFIYSAEEACDVAAHAGISAKDTRLFWKLTPTDFSHYIQSFLVNFKLLDFVGNFLELYE